MIKILKAAAHLAVTLAIIVGLLTGQGGLVEVMTVLWRILILLDLLKQL